jgi:hypothetical protein
VNAEFNVWLLIVGLVVGAGLVWLVIMDSRRRESEVDSVERPREAAWLSAVLREDGHDVTPEAAERMLELHRAYLDAPPPDPLVTADAIREPVPASEPVAPVEVEASMAAPVEPGPEPPRRRRRATKAAPADERTFGEG